MKPTTSIVTRRAVNNTFVSKQTPDPNTKLEIKENLPLYTNNY